MYVCVAKGTGEIKQTDPSFPSHADLTIGMLRNWPGKTHLSLNNFFKFEKNIFVE